MAQPERGAEMLERLAAEAARSCHVQEAVLACGSTVLVRWQGEPGPRFVVAAQIFGVGASSYELQLLDARQRTLTPEEIGALQAFTWVFQQTLESAVSVEQAAQQVAVKDHVAVALDYVTESFVLLARDWTIEHVNSQFERTVGLSRAQLVGRNLWELFPQRRNTPFETQIRAAMEATTPSVFEVHSEIAQRWFQSRAFPCKDGLAVLTVDVTADKQEESMRFDAERKALQSQRMESLGTLAGGIAHDFNNILGAILGHVGLLKELVPPGGAGRESVEQIEVAGRRARDLVQQILTFARTSSREFAHLPLRPFVEESVRLLRSSLPAVVRVDEFLTDDPLTSTLNPTETQQIVLNLGTNAWHAVAADDGRIEIHLARVSLVAPKKTMTGTLQPGLYAELIVSDNGSGISPDHLVRIFEPFFTTKLRGQGTGLGLHVVHGIVNAHGGAIDVTSQPGVGTQIALYLPATGGEQIAPPSEPDTSTLAGPGGRVAYVDDDAVMLLMVQRVLERAGFQVTTFTDPQALIAALQGGAEGFDLLVTDYSMPGMSGIELARTVRAQVPDLPLILATGYVTDTLRAAIDELGNAEILNKERCFDELGTRAAKAVRRMRAAP